MISVKNAMEQHAFGVCQYLGDRMGIAPGRIRAYFIYLSFGTLGSSILLYLFLAFWVNIRRYLSKYTAIWD
jgi:phage shock protein PspC (stress-responsive transcriptional regulator)